MQQQADEEELGLSTAALAALKEFALENNLLDLDMDSDLDVRLQVQDHMDVKERAHDFCFTFEDDEGHGEQVSIALTGVNPELGQTLASTGLTVWRAAQEMARFMWEHRRWFAGKRVVELGAGLGLCGVLASKLCVGGAVVITDGGEEFTDSAMEALRRNLEKNSCNLCQGGRGGEERVVVESGGDGGDGDVGGTAPRYPQRSAGTGAGDTGSGNDKREHDDGDEDINNEGNGNGDDVDADADNVVGGGEEKGGARGAKVLLERLTWGEHADFLKRNGGGGGGGGDSDGGGGGGGDDSSAVVDCERGKGGRHGGAGDCGGGGGAGFDFIVAADVIYEEEAVSPLLHTVVDILNLRRAADSCRRQQQQQQQQPQTTSLCPPPPSVSTFLLAFARRNISIDRVLVEAESLGLVWRVPQNFNPTSSSENIYLMCLA